MSDATKLQDLQWRAIEAVNKLVECDDADVADRHAAIERVHAHLEARLEQTAKIHEINSALAFLRDHVIVAVVGDNSDLAE